MSINADYNKEKNLMNLSIIRCNNITIKKIKCLSDNLKNKYYIKLYSNTKRPQTSKIISFKKTKEIELNQSFPLETFQQKIIKEIKFEFYNEKDDSILFNGIIINQNFILDETTGDYILNLYDNNGKESIIIYYTVEYSAIDSFETFDKSVKFNEITNKNYLDKARKNIPQDENIKNEFIENLQYLEIISIYFIDIIKWKSIIETLLFLILTTFIILYFQIFYIYILPIYIIIFYIKNKNKIRDLLNSKKNSINKRQNELFFIKLQVSYNNFIELYEIFIQRIIAGKKSMIIEIYKSLILTVVSNVILFYFNFFYIIKWKWLIIIAIWVFILSYNSFCKNIYISLANSLSSFSSIGDDNKYINKIKKISNNLINLLVPFYPLYKSFKEENMEVYSSMVKSQGLKSSNSNELRVAKSSNYKKGGNNLIKFELYENERWWVVVGWTKNLAEERPTWCRVDKPFTFCDKNKVFLPNDENNKYQWSADWKIEKNDNTDEEGWEYSANFNSKFSKNDKFKVVRRRKWVRYANKI